MSDQNGNGGEPVGKKRSIDDIIDHMTADLQSYEGQYILLGSPHSSQHIWPDYSSQPQQPSPQVPLGSPVYLQQPSYDLPEPKVPDYQTQHASLFYGSPAPPRVMPDAPGQEMIGMVDMGNGNYVNVVFNTAASQPSQMHQYAAVPTPSMSDPSLNYIYQQRQAPVPAPGQVRDYGLFTSKPAAAPNQPAPQANQQLIENLVGNWLPNQSGTYSPFGGTKSQPLSNDGMNGIDDSMLRPSHPGPPNALAGARKPRAVAEVRPMRPTYSDVLTKSPPPFPVCNKAVNSVPPTPVMSGNATPKSDVRKPATKSRVIKDSLASKLGSSLRRQHSSGSEEASKLGSGRRWISLEDLSAPTQTGSDQTATYELQLNEDSVQSDRESTNRREKKPKKKAPKQAVADEKTEALNNHKVGNVSFVGSKRPLQINNNLQRNRSNIEKNVPKQPKKGISSKDESKSGISSPSGTKRVQRSGKRRQGQTYIGVLWNKWQHYTLLFANWFLNLIWDVMALSTRLFVHMCEVSLEYTISMMHCGWLRVRKMFGVRAKWKMDQRRWWHFWNWNKKQPKPPEKPYTPEGLANNMAIPATGDDAIRRLLSCKGKDPYSILGVTRNCNDEEIKKYYKRQAVLVHPDKNSQPGAEEAFKILVHAFELIGEPERRSRYDDCVAETHQMEHAWTELNDLLTRLHQKMEYTANTIRCTNCGKRHRRVAVQRPCYAARFCAQCKIHHSAREGDIWAESWVLGFVWHYYACMEGQIYNITEWASCQAENLQHLKANSHAVQYRIVLGKQQHQQPASASSAPQPPPGHQQGSQPQQPEARQSEPDFEEFLNNLYSQSSSNGTMNSNGESGATRQRRKTRRKK